MLVANWEARRRVTLPFLLSGPSEIGNEDGRNADRPHLPIAPLSLETTPHDELADRLRAGDHAAFRAVWDRYHERLANFAYRYLRSEDAAADVVQHVFVALWERRQSFQLRSTIANYLYAAVRNRLGNMAHHERVVREYATRVAASHPATGALAPERPDAAIEAAELAAAIARVLEGLPPRTREIFLLSREDGLSPSEISALIGVTLQVVYNQIARALKRLSEGLSETRSEGNAQD
jgi:RNA polymerase sigma-70 factor (family 1)